MIIRPTKVIRSRDSQVWSKVHNNTQCRNDLLPSQRYEGTVMTQVKTKALQMIIHQQRHWANMYIVFIFRICNL